MRLRIGLVALSVTVSGLLAAAYAQAQTAAPAAAPGQELQEVTVSASAISIAGYEAPPPSRRSAFSSCRATPAPTSAMSFAVCRRSQTRPLPENDAYQGLFSAGIQGEDLANLRNLGIQRTLVLFDGQRVVQTNIQGGVDMSTIPSSLIERVDNVTGGASATWGSDALAGVVNLIINKNFNGFGANLEYGNNDQYLHPQEKLELTAGTAFGDGAGSHRGGGLLVERARSIFRVRRSGLEVAATGEQSRLHQLPGRDRDLSAGQPTWLHADYVGLATASTGGLITQTGLTGRRRRAQQHWVRAGRHDVSFNPGNVSEGFFSNGGTPNYDKGFIGINAAPLRNETAFR